MPLSPVVSSFRGAARRFSSQEPSVPLSSPSALSSAAVSGGVTEKWPPNLGFNVRKLPILANLGEGGFPLRK